MSGIEIAAIDAGFLAPTWQTSVMREATQSFADVLVRGVDGVNEALQAADTAVVASAVDGSEPPHQVMLAMEEARLAFQLALQVRNHVVEGYQELMRMQA